MKNILFGIMIYNLLMTSVNVKTKSYALAVLSGGSFFMILLALSRL